MRRYLVSRNLEILATVEADNVFLDAVLGSGASPYWNFMIFPDTDQAVTVAAFPYTSDIFIISKGKTS
jgi:hypothetical protein